MKKQKFSEGDYFAIPISDEESAVQAFQAPYAFGRLIAILPSKNQIIEIFRYTSDKLPDDVSVLHESGRLFDPVSTMAGLMMGRWRVIKSNPGFDREDAHYSEIRLAMKRGVPQHMWQLWRGGKAVSATPEELLGIEEYIIYAPQQVEQRIRTEMQKQVEK
jgi:hypothetical protein